MKPSKADQRSYKFGTKIKVKPLPPKVLKTIRKYATNETSYFLALTDNERKDWL